MFLNRFDAGRLFLRSTAIQQTLLLLGVFTLVTTVAWVATYWMVVRDSNRLVELRLEALVDTTLTALENGDDLPPVGYGQYLAQLPVGGIQQGELPIEFNPVDKRIGFYRLESEERNEQADYVVLIHDAPGMRIVASENVERLEETTDILLSGLPIALLATVLATLVAGLWIARKNQTRLNKISAGLARVSQGELDSRINLSAPNDDLNFVASHIDTTTTRLESAMLQMRNQTANIAHDLRTPLARLRAVIEERHIALSEQNEPVSEAALKIALDQIDRIVDTFNALLRIARIESGEQKSSFTSLDLGQLANDAADTFRAVIEDRGQALQVTLSEPANITCDPDMIMQLIGNLIQNAMRYGAEGQTLSLAVDDSQLSLTDQGPGIPAAERENVLQPLYQLEKQRQGEGFGLGLSLVNAICKLHDAQLALADGPAGVGLSVVVEFP